MSETQYGVEIPNRIFVGGIAFNTTELELKNFFQTFGIVKDTKIITDRSGVSKGYGFITFDNQEDATRVQEQGCVYFREKKLNIGPAIRKQPGGQFHKPSVPAADFERQCGSTSPPTPEVAFPAEGMPAGGYGVLQYQQPSVYVHQNGTWFFNHDGLLQQHSPPAFYPFVPHLYTQQPCFPVIEFSSY
jgi:hypothetical protein